MKMTAFEMASKFKWAKVQVIFNFGTGYNGHVAVEGQTRIVSIEGSSGSAVWVGPVALSFDTIVYVDPIGEEGATVRVDRYQEAA
jgi:hypothetical protein